MDAIDREILAEVLRDGRQSVTDLARRVRLTVSPCHRRLRSLEDDGVIVGYHAEIDAHALGLRFDTLVFVTMADASRPTVTEFEQAVAAIPQVVQAQRLFGDPDYLIRVVTEDLPGFQELYDEKLTALPGIQRLSSTLVMKHVVDGPRLPL